MKKMTQTSRSNCTDLPILLTMSSKPTHPTKKEWKIPQEIDSQISLKCPNGLSLVCKTCSKWDVDSSKFGTIYSKAEHPFSWGRFPKHTQTQRHKSNERKRDFWHA